MEFKRLAEVTAAEEAGDAANVLIEEGGEIKRVPKTAVGGASAGPVFTQVAASTYAAAAEPTYVYDCSMTFEEILAQYNEGTLMSATFSAIYTADYEAGIENGMYLGAIAFDSAGSALYPTTAENAYALMFFFMTVIGQKQIMLYCLSDGTITDQEPTFPDAGSNS